MVAAFDQILAAPVIHEPIALKHESVAYTFADSKLEKLPPIQKTLLRMGPENTETIQKMCANCAMNCLARVRFWGGSKHWHW